MKTKVSEFFSCCKYELTVFAALCIGALLNLQRGSSVGEYISIYYLSDYSMGFSSRLLPGSIVSLLNDKPSMEWINGFAVVVLMLTLLFASILVGNVIKNTKSEIKAQALILAAFMVSGSFTFSFFSDVLGFLDIYMFIAAMLAVVCLQNKITRWFVPALCAVGVLAHNIFIVTYFPLVALTLLYAVISGKNKAVNSVLLVLSVVLTLGLTLLFTVNSGGMMNITFEEFCEIIRQKGPLEYDDSGLQGIGFHLFGIAGDDFAGYVAGTAVDMPFYMVFFYMIKYNFSSITLSGALSVIIFTVFIFSAFWIIWIKCAKNTESKSRKFLYVCFILSTLTVIAGFLVAADYVRWVQACMLTQFALIFLMFCSKDEPFEKTMVQLKEYFSNKKLLLLIIYIVYATAVQQDLAA